MGGPAVEIQGDRLRVVFADYAAGPAYELFKAVKRLPEYEVVLDDDGLATGITAPARFAAMLGVLVPTPSRNQLPWPKHFNKRFDDQPAITQLALDAKRYACWSDCGLGKTPIGLEFARQVCHRTGGRVLIVTLNEIAGQWLTEAEKFYPKGGLPIVRLNSREEMKRWCATGRGLDTPSQASHPPAKPEDGGGPVATAAIAVVNYEKFNHTSEADQVVSELRQLAGIVLDESSRLKTGGGKQKWALIKSARGIQYKLSLTATPAPNELMEFASQASFLERMRSESVADAAQQIIWTYFTRDPKTHRWTIKKHARAAFFEWMASWSIYVRNPKAFGWRTTWAPPPEPEYFRHEIAITPEQRQLVMDFNADPRNVAEANVGSMFAGEMNAIVATKLSQAAKGFIYTKGQPDERLDDGSDALTGERLLSDLQGTQEPAADDVRQGLPTAAGEAEAGSLQPHGRGVRAGRRGGDEEPGRLDVPRSARPTRRGARAVHSLKPQFVADLIAAEVHAGHQVLVWTVFDEETAILERLLRAHPKLRKQAMRDVDALTGSTNEDDRACILEDFRAGHCRVLLSRAAILGYGMNLQFVTSMVFSGWSFSYEQFYQAVRRAYRHGQTERVRVHLPVIAELEGQMYDAIVRKQKQHEEAIAEMEANYISARRSLTCGEGRAS